MRERIIAQAHRVQLKTRRRGARHRAPREELTQSDKAATRRRVRRDPHTPPPHPQASLGLSPERTAEKARLRAVGLALASSPNAKELRHPALWELKRIGRSLTTECWVGCIYWLC